MAKIKVGKGSTQGTAQSVAASLLTGSASQITHLETSFSNAPAIAIAPTTIVSAAPTLRSSTAAPDVSVTLGGIPHRSSSKETKKSGAKANPQLIAEILSVMLKGGSLAGVLCLALLLGERAFRQQAEAPINAENLPFVSIAADYGANYGSDHSSETDEEASAEATSRFSGPISGPIFSGVTKIFTIAASPVAELAPQLPTLPLLQPDPVAEQAAEAKVLADSRNRTAMSFIAGLIAAHRPSITNCEEVAKHIIELSRYYKTDPFYVAAVISVESRFGETAKSKAGAVGLMQLLPQTAAEVAFLKTGTQGRPKLTDGRTNIALGIAYLMNLQKQFDGDRFATLAAYNWGPKNVIDVNRSPERFPKEVRKYASTVIERAEQWRKHFQKTEQTSAQMSRG